MNKKAKAKTAVKETDCGAPSVLDMCTECEKCLRTRARLRREGWPAEDEHTRNPWERCS